MTQLTRAGALLCVAILLATARAGEAPQQERDAGWEEARAGFEPQLPRDHAAHPDHRIEWWYFTGNLETAGGRRFGYQLTFFRTGIVREPATRSRWALRDLYLAHFAISDLQASRLHHFERAARAGVGWAGALADECRVWIEDWQVRLEGDEFVLRAETPDEDAIAQLELTCTPAKPAVLHGVDGISQKGSAEGNASHYLSLTRLDTVGSLRVGGESFTVTGLSWFDHEWGTSFLEEGQLGWDWLSLQLEDGRDLMLYRFRREDGAVDPHSSGTVVAPDGASVHLAAADFTLEPLETWTSPMTGGEYPVRWRARVPSLALELEVASAFPDQELQTPGSTRITYWEGAVTATGEARGAPARGRGYLEMTGYAGRPLGQAFGESEGR